MPTLSIETDIYSLVGVVAGGFAFGALLAWLLLRRSRRRRATTVNTEGLGDLYLVFSRVSHQLKTAGEVIRGHLHPFTDELPSDAERWRVARRSIAEEASRVDGLIDRMDLVVRLGMADQPLVMEPVSIPHLLEDLMVGLAPAADEKGIVLGGIAGSPATNETHISADPMALREVFSNLMENAVKHNGSGTEITAEVNQQGQNLIVKISDTGKGVPKETLANLFDKGSRSYRPGTARGTGMGLYLSKLLIELHGGEITASSEDGKGTEFRIVLPIRRSQ